MKSTIWPSLHRLCPFGIVKPAEKKRGDREKLDDPEKLVDQEKLGDQEKLRNKTKLTDKINFFPWSKKNEGENQDKRERVIHEKLARFAQVPRSNIFEFVYLGFIPFVHILLTNSKLALNLNLVLARVDYQLKQLALPWGDMVPMYSLVIVALRHLVSYFRLSRIRSISSF